MSEVIKALKLSMLENELLDVHREIKKHEGIVNSTNIRSDKFKGQSKKKLMELVTQRNELTTKITDAVLLDMEI